MSLAIWDAKVLNFGFRPVVMANISLVTLMLPDDYPSRNINEKKFGFRYRPPPSLKTYDVLEFREQDPLVAI